VLFVLGDRDADGQAEAQLRFWGEPFMARATVREVPALHLWTPEANEDLLEARAWYDNIRPVLGERFAMAAEATVEALAEHPLQFTVMASRKWLGSDRPSSLHGLPMRLRVVLADSIEVVSQLSALLPRLLHGLFELPCQPTFNGEGFGLFSNALCFEKAVGGRTARLQIPKIHWLDFGDAVILSITVNSTSI
jgi:plasmid stabilization system protein ParE